MTQKERLLQEQLVCEKAKVEIDNAIGALYLDKTRGKVTEESFDAIMNQFQQKQTSLTERLREIHCFLETLKNDNIGEKDIHNFVKRCVYPERLTREIVDIFIDHISVERREKGEKYPLITVYWNF